MFRWFSSLFANSLRLQSSSSVTHISDLTKYLANIWFRTRHKLRRSVDPLSVTLVYQFLIYEHILLTKKITKRLDICQKKRELNEVLVNFFSADSLG